MKVARVNTNATDIVLAENMFNDRPPSGSTYVLITLRFKRLASGSGGPWLEYDFQLLPQSGAFIDEASAVIPKEISDLELFQGRSGTANIVFMVPRKKLSGLKLRTSYYDSSFTKREFYINVT